MLLLGILSIVQIIFLPGFIFLESVKLKTQTKLQWLLYVFALSLFLNYLLVTSLTLLGLYKLPSLFFIIVIEIICSIYLLIKNDLLRKLNTGIRDTYKKLLILIRQTSSSKKFIIITTSIVLLFYISLFVSNLGTVFYFVDTVNNIHWNTWAIDFANNHLPVKSSHFPQLIPSNWSISYLLTEPNVHLFPKAIMPLFFIGNLLIFLDIGLRKKNSIYLIGLIIYGLFAPIIYSLVFIADGNADLPVSFFSFLAFYSFIFLDKKKFRLEERLLFFLFAASAAATKLAGFYIFTVVSAISLYQLIQLRRDLNKKKTLVTLLSVITILFFTLLWHFLKPDVMVSGLHQPEYVGTNYLKILVKAINLILYNWGIPVFAFFVITIIGSLFVKRIQWLTLVMVIPPWILWMLKYSVDFRNLSFVVPYLCLVSAFGLIFFIEKMKSGSVRTSLQLEKNKDISPNSFNKVCTWIILVSLGLAVFIRFDIIYDLIFNIYEAIRIQYFRSHRINLLVDYTPYVNIDYYQNTISNLFGLIGVLSLLALLKIKLKYLIIGIVGAVVLLNFTLLKKEDIVYHQKKSFEVIDARNYTTWINPIIRNLPERKAYTNFRTISEINIKRDFNFLYKNNIEIKNKILDDPAVSIIFIKMDLMKENFRGLIDKKISDGEIKVLYDDFNYILLKTK